MVVAKGRRWREECVGGAAGGEGRSGEGKWVEKKMGEVGVWWWREGEGERMKRGRRRCWFGGAKGVGRWGRREERKEMEGGGCKVLERQVGERREVRES